MNNFTASRRVDDITASRHSNYLISPSSRKCQSLAIAIIWKAEILEIHCKPTVNNHINWVTTQQVTIGGSHFSFWRIESALEEVLQLLALIILSSRKKAIKQILRPSVLRSLKRGIWTTQIIMTSCWYLKATDVTFDDLESHNVSTQSHFLDNINSCSLSARCVCVRKWEFIVLVNSFTQRLCHSDANVWTVFLDFGAFGLPSAKKTLSKVVQET